MKLLFTTSCLINALFSFSLSLFVIYKNQKSILNFSWCVTCFFIGLWATGLWGITSANNLQMSLFFLKIHYFGAFFIPPSFLFFIYSFFNAHNKYKRTIIISYVVSAFFFISNFSGLVAAGVSKKFLGGFYADGGILFKLFVFECFILISYAIYYAIKNFNSLNQLRRNQLVPVMYASAIGFLGGGSTIIPVYFPDIYPVGTSLVTFYVILTTYAIAKHHSTDMEIIIKKTVVYSILTTIVMGIFIAAIFIKNYLGITVGRGFLLIWFLASFPIAIFLNPLRDQIQKTADKLFFKARYDYQSILRKYSHILSRPMTNLNEFSKIAPYLLSKSLALSGASFMVLDRENHSYKVRAGYGRAEKIIGLTILEDSPLIKYLLGKKTEVNLEEINYALKSNSALDYNERKELEAIKKEMDGLQADLVIPCISDSQYFKKPTLLSTINLGKKLSEDSFLKEDVSFLKTLANQSAISIEYAFIFEELKQNQEQIIKSEKLAALGSITAGIAHELKNPITYILTISQLLSEMPNDKNVIENAAKNLPAEAERMKLIVEGILGYSRAKQLNLVELNIVEVSKRVLALVSYDIKKNKIQIKENYMHSKKIVGDPNHLIQVFMNLIVNAIQAIGEKEGEITISSCDKENCISISVKDTGPGISEENISKLFNPFHTTKESGTGLGLAISKKIIEEHNGNIYVNSKVGEGTTFTVDLPIKI